MENNSEMNIYKLVQSDLNDVAFHQAVSSIQRMVPESFPIHLAVHSVLAKENFPTEIYSTPHMHADQDEVNILISKTEMVYNIRLDNVDHVVSAPASI